MLIIGDELSQARELLSLHESLISEYESNDCLDYVFCQTMFGILSYCVGKATEVERHLLSSKTIIANVMEPDNDYMKTVYLQKQPLHVFSFYSLSIRQMITSGNSSLNIDN